MYSDLLDQFIKSQDAGVDVVEEWDALDNRTVATIRRGFVKAVKDANKEHKVRVLTADHKVYLIKEGNEKP
jgi:hypothetical protein